MFYGCQTVEEIVIPSTVASIGNKAFFGCSNLKSLIFTETPEGQTPCGSGYSGYTQRQQR